MYLNCKVIHTTEMKRGCLDWPVSSPWICGWIWRLQIRRGFAERVWFSFSSEDLKKKTQKSTSYLLLRIQGQAHDKINHLLFQTFSSQTRINLFWCSCGLGFFHCLSCASVDIIRHSHSLDEFLRHRPVGFCLNSWSFSIWQCQQQEQLPWFWALINPHFSPSSLLIPGKRSLKFNRENQI